MEIPKNKAEAEYKLAHLITELAQDEWVIVFSVLRDYHGIGKKRLRKLWDITTVCCSLQHKGGVKYEEILNKVASRLRWSLTEKKVNYDLVSVPSRMNKQMDFKKSWSRAYTREKKRCETYCETVFLYCLLLMGLYAPEVERVKEEINKRREELQEKRIKITDLRTALEEEDGIVFTD